MTGPSANPFPYPRRLWVRRLLRWLARRVLGLVARFEVQGQANLPAGGPLIVVANHFSIVDVVAMVAATDWPLEFLGGLQLVDAPWYLAWIPHVWGYYPVRRGAASREAMRASLAVLEQGGVLCIFPEAGSWAQVLRPARPGTALIAVESGAPVLPIGLDGMPDVIPGMRRLRRARATVQIGRPMGPFVVPGRGRARRQALDEIGDELMRAIAVLIPPAKRGVYSADARLRAEAAAVAEFPYHDLYG
ncbi:MAG: 1-acyl-sn-glycerol-3-phosphate acyltransferase [Ardenticatenales bacterium]|nr:1-acyl-sn-glycerol-3-phosphate acyltransferase [Ardenticatenales bacterium]